MKLGVTDTVQRILLVDDQDYNLMALKVILVHSVGITDEKYYVNAHNGQVAFDKVK